MASTYLTRTPSSTTNRTTWTFSTWVKRSSLTNDKQSLLGSNNASSDAGYMQFRFIEGEKLNLTGYLTEYFITNRVFRDLSAWYHIVLAVDTTQTTAGNRIKLYVNGEEETSFSTSNNPSLNQDTPINVASSVNYIGSESYSSGTSRFFDGSMSHIHFIDGIAYDASAFGETDATTGEWEAKTSPSVTYGTNGFFILKDGNGITDQSGEGNDFTLGGGTLTDLKDNPENVFATFNPLASKVLGTVGFTLENGNTVLNPSSSTAQWTTSTICTPSTGKFYWEMKSTSSAGTDWPDIGFMFTDNISTHMALTTNPQHNFSYVSVIEANGTKWDLGTQTTSWFGGFNSNDIINCAVDVSAGKFWWGVNGSWLNSGDPVNGTNHGSNFTAGTSITAWVSQYNVGDVQANFGNGYFGTTAITTNSGNGYAGAEGASKFNYTVPTGYSALNTKGLNE